MFVFRKICRAFLSCFSCYNRFGIHSFILLPRNIFISLLILLQTLIWIPVLELNVKPIILNFSFIVSRPYFKIIYQNAGWKLIICLTFGKITSVHCIKTFLKNKTEEIKIHHKTKIKSNHISTKEISDVLYRIGYSMFVSIL